MADLIVTKTAAGKAMTLAELRELVADCDRLECPDSMAVEARGGWSGSKRLTLKRGKASRSRDVADIDPRPDTPMNDLVPARQRGYPPSVEGLRPPPVALACPNPAACREHGPVVPPSTKLTDPPALRSERDLWLNP